MRRLFAAAFAALLLYVVLLGSRLPAEWAVGQYADRLPFQVDDVQGSIWSGTARLSYAGVHFDSVRWQLAFWPLLLGEQHIDLQANDPGLRLQARLKRAGEYSQFVISELWMDMSRLNQLRVFPAGMEIAGELQGQGLQLAIERDVVTDAAGQLGWSPAYLLAPQSYRHEGFIAELKPDNGQLSVLVNDRGGEVSFEAIGCRLSTQAREQASNTVREVIRRFGRLDSEGRLNLQASGRF
jgi:hypothetical protein